MERAPAGKNAPNPPQHPQCARQSTPPILGRANGPMAVTRDPALLPPNHEPSMSPSRLETCASLLGWGCLMGDAGAEPSRPHAQGCSNTTTKSFPGYSIYSGNHARPIQPHAGPTLQQPPIGSPAATGSKEVAPGNQTPA